MGRHRVVWRGGGRGLIRRGGTSKGTKRIISSIVSNRRFIILGFVGFVPANVYPCLRSPCLSFIFRITIKFVAWNIRELHLIAHCARPENLELWVPETVLRWSVRVRGTTLELLAVFAWVVLPMGGRFAVTGWAAVSHSPAAVT